MDPSPLEKELARLAMELAFCARTFGLASSQTMALEGIAADLRGCVDEARRLHRLVLESPPLDGELERGDVLTTTVHPHLESERGRA